jgi:peptide/nickel transport system ATP-binding protein
MLEARGVGHRFGRDGEWVFRGVTLQVAPGERVGLFGPSGLGKTTLGRILGGYIAPAEGTVHFDGRPLAPTGYCPVQCIHQHPELAVNPRWPLGKSLREAFSPPDSLLEALGISPAWLERYPHELSGGELQRIAVARALGPRTRCIVADEMTSMLDALTQAFLWKAVTGHCQEHRVGLLVISHDSALMGRLCERVMSFGERS